MKGDSQQSPVYNYPELLRRAIQYYLAHVHTAQPGEIVDYDPETQLASVKPLIMFPLSNGKSLSTPVIHRVPVQFSRSRAASISFKITKGDPCTLIFCERSLDAWMEKGEEAPPSQPRRHDLTDAIAIPGLFAPGVKPVNPENLDLVIETDAASITLDGDDLTCKAPNATLTDGVAAVNVTGGRLALRGAAGEALALIVEALTLASLSTSTSPGSVVAPNPGLAAIIVQLQAIIGA